MLWKQSKYLSNSRIFDFISSVSFGVTLNFLTSNVLVEAPVKYEFCNVTDE